MASKPGIYIHIPFCVSKCRYCAFLSGPVDGDTVKEYVRALERELCSYKDELADRVFDTVYFGGGTPSLLEPEAIKSVLDTLRCCFALEEDAELTLEANPGTLGSTDAEIRERLAGYKAAGINRLSMGAQSMDDKRLSYLGRIHSADDVRRDFRLAREAGFDNISLDLITAVPGMSLEDALWDVEEIISLGPEHISMYTLQLEEGTALHRAWERGEFELMDEDADREMYHSCSKALEKAGYLRYEISNFARDGRMSRHNSKYWDMSEYLGAGLGASGYVGGVRYRNTEVMEEYLQGRARAEEHVNTRDDDISEAVFTGLRRRDGILMSEICKDFRKHYDDVWSEVLSFAEDGFLIIDGDRMRLTDKGIDISNRIMALFV